MPFVFEPDTVVDDRFHLVRPLSAGSMGTVWVARHTRFDVPCAVKFIQPECVANAELRARFDREAKAAAKLQSPHVVHLFDYGVFEGTPYLAMELLDGETLADRLAARGKLTPGETVALLAQVARALTKAHAAELVHRDLKPENIFLAKDDDREIAKVLDFGVVKVASDRKTLTGAILGTPSYMSPEQAKGLADVDYRSDLWALAVLAFECITGRLPFTGRTLVDVLTHILIAPLPLPSEIAEVPLAFDLWWEKAASRDPNHRFKSAFEQVSALAKAFELPRSSLMPRRRSGKDGDTSLKPPPRAIFTEKPPKEAVEEELPTRDEAETKRLGHDATEAPSSEADAPPEASSQPTSRREPTLSTCDPVTGPTAPPTTVVAPPRFKRGVKFGAIAGAVVALSIAALVMRSGSGTTAAGGVAFAAAPHPTAVAVEPAASTIEAALPVDATPEAAPLPGLGASVSATATASATLAASSPPSAPTPASAPKPFSKRSLLRAGRAPSSTQTPRFGGH